MKQNLALIAIIWGFSFATLAAEPTLSLDSLSKQPTPENKPITTTSEEKGEEHTYEVESTVRFENIYPNNWGTAGIFRVRSAESLPPHTLAFGIGGEFYSIGNGPDFGTGSDASTIAESLFFGYSPTDRLTLAVARRNSSTTYGTPRQLISSLGDFNFSGLYSFPLSESFAIGPVTNFLVASNFNSLSPAVTTLSVGGGLAATYSFSPTFGLPLFLHSNVLYHMPQVRSTSSSGAEAYYNFSRFHTITLAMGAEYRIGSFVPFAEVQDTIHTDSSLSFGHSPMKISVGTRFMPLENKSLSILLGADIAMVTGKINGVQVAGVPYTPDFQILAQVSYTVGVTQTERKHYHTTTDVNVVDRKFVISKNIQFKVGKAELDPISHELLDQIAEVVKKNQVKRLLIAGHTDSSHTDQFNLKLSIDRANAVKTYLTNRGIPSETFTTQGFGKRKPKASNATEAGRQENRRVEFFILE